MLFCGQFLRAVPAGSSCGQFLRAVPAGSYVDTLEKIWWTILEAFRGNFFGTFFISLLICTWNSGDISGQLCITGELRHMFHHPLDHLWVAFSEGRHQTGDFAVVLAVNVCPRRVQKLNHIQVTPIGSQPQTRVAFLITNIDLGSPEIKKKK